MAPGRHRHPIAVLVEHERMAQVVSVKLELMFDATAAAGNRCGASGKALKPIASTMPRRP